MNENQDSSLQDLQAIKNLMERSTRFISLSGLSGIAAGCFALLGAAIAHFVVFASYYQAYNERGSFDMTSFRDLKITLFFLAFMVFVGALSAALYFTWKKAKKANLPMWSLSSKRLLWNVLIPVLTGGIFIIAMLQNGHWQYVVPACLIFYGLGLINGSKYTLSDIRYLGFAQIIIGLVSTQFTGYGLYFWALGFGIMHIFYGMVMWYKYDRK